MAGPPTGSSVQPDEKQAEARDEGDPKQHLPAKPVRFVISENLNSSKDQSDDAEEIQPNSQIAQVGTGKFVSSRNGAPDKASY
jgi:hypothetical protein